MTTFGVLAAVGLLSWAMRVTFASAVNPERLAGALVASLEYAGPAVLAALVAGELFGESGLRGFVSPSPPLIAALVATGVAWRTAGLGRTVLSAVCALGVLQVVWP